MPKGPKVSTDEARKIEFRPTIYSISIALALGGIFSVWVAFMSGNRSIGNFSIPGVSAAAWAWTAGLCFLSSAIYLGKISASIVALIRIRNKHETARVFGKAQLAFLFKTLAVSVMLATIGYWLTNFLNARAITIDETATFEWDAQLVKLFASIALAAFATISLTVGAIASLQLFRLPRHFVDAYEKQLSHNTE